MSKVYTKFRDIQKIIEETSPLYICLLDSDGNKVIPFNNSKSKGGLKGRMEQIKATLNSETTEPGYYVVRMTYTSFSKNTPFTDLVFQKGEIPNEEKAPVINIVTQNETMSETPSENVLGYDAVLELQRKLIQTQSDLKIANAKIEDLEAEIEDLNIELKEGEENKGNGFQLSENTQSFLEGTLGMATGIVDRFLEVREQQIELEHRKMDMANPQTIHPEAGQQHNQIQLPDNAEEAITYIYESGQLDLNRLAQFQANRPLYMEIQTIIKEYEQSQNAS